jgi:feruloyl esterase
MRTVLRLTVSAAAAFLVAVTVGALVGTAAPATAAAGGPTPCESLARLSLPNATITLAETVPPGTFTPPAPVRAGDGVRRGGGPAPALQGGGRAAVAARIYAGLPSFCRVTATLTPTSDSEIRTEVWLPTAGWNGKFQAVGNGGWAGVISYQSLAQAVAAGYATASTDTGHTGNSAAFALGHPEKVVDMGYRAVHEMTVQAKAIADAFYGAQPRLSIWNGCSQGGRQGITEAQRYPADYDAIIAGAPAVNWMRLNGVRMAINLRAHEEPDGTIPAEKFRLIHDAVLDACDPLDGVKDGVLENPGRCKFDPKVLECKAEERPSCLTKAEVETARAIYAPVKHPKTGATISPALLLPGSELGWGTLAGQEPVGTALDAYRYVVFKDANWDWHRFDAATDIDLALKLDKGILDSADPNLTPFFRRGGKLLMYHGWADPQVPALNSIEYFDRAVRAAGKNAVGTSIQLYMVPGMAHCQGGPGTDIFDKVAAIEQWIEKGHAPDHIVASHLTDGSVDRTRPICPYGKVARWSGVGSQDEAANFTCVVEPGESLARSR